VHQFGCESLQSFTVPRTPARIDADIAIVVPAQIAKRSDESCNACLACSIGFAVRREQHAHAPDTRAPLRPRRKRPGCRNAADKADEFASPHRRPRRKRNDFALLHRHCAINVS
jgi:hypothetical protein